MTTVPVIRIPIIRITDDGSWRITDDGAVRIVGYQIEDAVAAVIDIYFQGLVVQRNLTEAVAQWLTGHGGLFLETDIADILALANALLDVDVLPPYLPTTQDHYPLALPPLPAPLPRFPDANPAPDGWSIVTDEKVVRGRAVIEVALCRTDDVRTAPNFPDLAEEYKAEAAIREMPWPQVSWQTYQSLEQNGVLHAWAARDDGVLIGFVVLITSMSPEYGVPLTCTEAFFVAAASRHTGAGLKLLAAAEAKARALGSPGLAINAPLGGRLAGLLPKCGFREVGRCFFKGFADA